MISLDPESKTLPEQQSSQVELHHGDGDRLRALRPQGDDGLPGQGRPDPASTVRRYNIELLDTTHPT